MIRCKTCGAECQNPFDRYGETGKRWLGIHGRGEQAGNVKHELDELSNNQIALIMLMDIVYTSTHKPNGQRLDTI